MKSLKQTEKNHSRQTQASKRHMDRIEASSPPGMAPMPLEARISDFGIYLEKQGHAASTIRVYSCSVRLFFHHYDVLSIEHLQAYRRWLLESYKPSTVNTRILGINRFLDFMQSNTLLDNNLPSLNTICSKFLKHSCIQKADFQALTSPPADSLRITPTGHYRLRPIREQKRTYLDTVISQKDYDRLKRRLKKDENYFWYFIVRFLASTGARVSELRQIKMEDLQLGYLDLYSKGGKIRRLFFPRSLCEEAIPYFASRGIDSGFLFLTRRHTCISARAIEMQLKNIARRYRINPATMYPHSFRHRYAINFLKRFNDISLLADLLGHDSIETTRIYLMKSSQEQQTVIDRVVTW